MKAEGCYFNVWFPAVQLDVVCDCVRVDEGEGSVVGCRLVMTRCLCDGSSNSSSSSSCSSGGRSSR